MSRSTRVTVGAAASALALLATPAHAEDRQYPNCYYGELGMGYWYLPTDTDGSFFVTGLYFDRNGELVQSERVGYWEDGPTHIPYGLAGTDGLAPYAIIVESDLLEPQGTACRRESTAVFGLARDVGQELPPTTVRRQDVPPPPVRLR